MGPILFLFRAFAIPSKVQVIGFYDFVVLCLFVFPSSLPPLFFFSLFFLLALRQKWLPRSATVRSVRCFRVDCGDTNMTPHPSSGRHSWQDVMVITCIVGLRLSVCGLGLRGSLSLYGITGFNSYTITRTIVFYGSLLRLRLRFEFANLNFCSKLPFRMFHADEFLCFADGAEYPCSWRSLVPRSRLIDSATTNHCTN